MVYGYYNLNTCKKVNLHKCLIDTKYKNIDCKLVRTIFSSASFNIIWNAFLVYLNNNNNAVLTKPHKPLKMLRVCKRCASHRGRYQDADGSRSPHPVQTRLWTWTNNTNKHNNKETRQYICISPFHWMSFTNKAPLSQIDFARGGRLEMGRQGHCSRIEFVLCLVKVRVSPLLGQSGAKIQQKNAPLNVLEVVQHRCCIS